jgi:hypothetical protein
MRSRLDASTPRGTLNRKENAMTEERPFDVAPTVFSERDFDVCMLPFVIAAEGLAMRLALEPAEHGWNQSTFHDHDIGMILTDEAVQACKAFAKANQLFYNTTKLEDAVTLQLTVSYGNAFIGRNSAGNGGDE